MKIQVETKRFQNVLKTVKAVVSSRSLIASLSNVHFHLEDGEMTLTTSNLENTMAIKMPYESDDMSEYEFMIECAILDKIVSKIKDASFTIEISENLTRGTILIRRGSFDFPMIPQDAISFVNLSESQFTDAEVIVMNRDAFLKAVKMSQKFQCSDQVHINLCSSFVKAVGNNMSIYATDRARMVKYTVETTSNAEKEVSFIMPQMSSVLVQSLSMGSDTIRFQCAEKNVKITNDKVMLILQKLDMAYPKCDAIIPKEMSENYIIANRQEILDCFSQAQLCGGEDNNAVKFEYNGNKVLISAQNIAMGRQADLEVTADFVKENTMKDGFFIGLVSDGFISMLGAQYCEFVKLYFTESNRPVVMHAIDAEGNENKNIDMLIMPILI